jgi:hypothetical protein
MSFTIKFSVLTLIFSIFFVFCKKNIESLPNLQTIEGNWVQESPLPSQEWRYKFNDGILQQSASVGNTTVVQYQFPYALRGDTVVIGGDSINPPRTWLLDFWCDSVVEVQPLNVLIAPRLLFRRE